MEKLHFNEYLENRYKKQLEYYSKTASENQKKYRTIQWVLIILSAATPVLAALIEMEKNLQFVVVIISAIVAILMAGLKTFQYQELWVSYRMTKEMLNPEYYYYSFNIGPYAEDGINKETLFVSRVESILDKEHSGWWQIKRSQQKEQEEKDLPPGENKETN